MSYQCIYVTILKKKYYRGAKNSHIPRAPLILITPLHTNSLLLKLVFNISNYINESGWNFLKKLFISKGLLQPVSDLVKKIVEIISMVMIFHLSLGLLGNGFSNKHQCCFISKPSFLKSTYFHTNYKDWLKKNYWICLNSFKVLIDF